MATTGAEHQDITTDTANAENDSAVSNSNSVCQNVLDDSSKPSDCKIAKTIGEELQEVDNSSEASTCETIAVKVIYNKNKYDVDVKSTATIADLKKQLHTLVGVPDSMQKLMYKGLLQDKHTVFEAGIQQGAKIMLVGSTLTDILSVSSVSKQDNVGSSGDSSTPSTKEPLCKQKLHRKVLDKGVPDDAMPGLGGDVHSPLPPTPLSGMLNRHGGKVRLTFKLETDQLWLSTKERTEKIAMGGIKAVVSEPIETQPHYHIVGLQLGPTEASRYWLYWVPAQYVQAIKHAILGQWQLL